MRRFAAVRRAVPFLIVLALTAAAPGGALADGDPASDTLLTRDVFYPYRPPVAPRQRRTLDRVVARARTAGYPVKVALIAGPGDLGAYPELFGDANRYATLLASELPPPRSGARHPRVLVVMPGGFGGVDLGSGVDRALGGLAVPGGARPDALASVAARAVARLATAAGHRVPEPAAPSHGGGFPWAVLVAVPVLLGAAALARTRHRMRQ